MLFYMLDCLRNQYIVFVVTCDTTVATNSLAVILGDCSIILNICLLLRLESLVDGRPRGREKPSGRKVAFLTVEKAPDRKQFSWFAIIEKGIL